MLIDDKDFELIQGMAQEAVVLFDAGKAAQGQLIFRVLSQNIKKVAAGEPLLTMTDVYNLLQGGDDE